MATSPLRFWGTIPLVLDENLACAQSREHIRAGHKPASHQNQVIPYANKKRGLRQERVAPSVKTSYAHGRMSRHFLVFGTHPLLSLAELKAVLGGRAPILVGPMAIVETDEWDGAWLQERLAGTIKLGNILFSCPRLELTAEKIIAALPKREGTSKLTFAVTSYGSGGSLKRLPLELKKALKASGRSIRWFSDDEGHVSPAAIAKLELTTTGYDIVVAIDHDTAYVGLTTQAQNADAWSLRDYGRPARDARNGMLPPKLAHMMVNLALGATSPNPSLVRMGTTLLDPFCGSGTVLMEAALLDQRLQLIGTDIDARQIADTEQNLDWMVEHQLISSARRAHIKCLVHDAQTLHEHLRGSVELVVTEGFLGRSLQGHETSVQLEREVQTITELWCATLASLAHLQPSGGLIVAVWPLFKTTHAVAEVDLTPFLPELEYELIDPLKGWSEQKKPLIYARADQKTRRRIVVLKRR